MGAASSIYHHQLDKKKIEEQAEIIKNADFKIGELQLKILELKQIQCELSHAAMNKSDLVEGADEHSHFCESANNEEEISEKEILDLAIGALDQASSLATSSSAQSQSRKHLGGTDGVSSVVNFAYDSFDEVCDKVVEPLANIVLKYPWMGPASTAIKLALLTARQVTGNKSSCQELGSRIAEVSLLLSELLSASAVSSSFQSSTPPSALAVHISHLVSCVGSCSTFMGLFVGRGFFSKMLNASSDAETFVELDERLSEITSEMSVAVQVKVMTLQTLTFAEVRGLAAKIDELGGAGAVKSDPKLLAKLGAEIGIPEEVFAEEMDEMEQELKHINDHLKDQTDLLKELLAARPHSIPRPTAPSLPADRTAWARVAPVEVYSYAQYQNECWKSDEAVPVRKFELTLENLFGVSGVSGVSGDWVDVDEDGKVGRSEWARLHGAWVREDPVGELTLGEFLEAREPFRKE